MMKRLVIYFSLIFFSCQKSDPQQIPTLAFINGKIWTGDEQNPWASWVSIKDDRIAEVGKSGESPDAKQVVDLKGRLMVPGFNDSHVHFAQAGGLLLGINLLDVNDDDLFIQRVKETTERLPKGSWITGEPTEAWALGSEGGETQKREFEPTRSLIDDITPNHPVLVTRFDRQVGMANEQALKELGIKSPTGIIRGAELGKSYKWRS